MQASLSTMKIEPLRLETSTPKKSCAGEKKRLILTLIRLDRRVFPSYHRRAIT